MIKVKRLCKNGIIPNHSEAKKIIKQLKRNPEVCENCKIKPCVLGKYLWK